MADSHQPHSLHSVSFNAAPASLQYEIALLHGRAYPEPDHLSGSPARTTLSTIRDDSVPRLHHAALDVMSFYLCVGTKMVSYAGVVRKTIDHDGDQFALAGLSCVATDKEFWGRGFGSRTVAAATRWIERGGMDFGIFSCDPPLGSFYERAGSWAVVSDVVLLGSAHEGALSSAYLDKIVLMRLFSQKALSCEARLRNTTIDLDLPLGQFL